MDTLIFDRSKHPIEPTKTGQQIINRARQILREVNGLKDFINTEKDNLSGTFRIGVIPTVAPYLMPRFLKDFSDQNPDINLKVREMESEQIIYDIKHDLLDIGIMATPLEESNLREIPLYNEPFLLYIAEQHPLFTKKSLKPEELPQNGLWLLTQGHCLRNQVLTLCNQRHSSKLANISYESGSIETLRNLVKNHMGYTLVPELSVYDEKKDPRIKRFVEPEPTREISLVVHKGFTKEAVLENLKDSIGQNLPKSFVKAKKQVRLKWR